MRSILHALFQVSGTVILIPMPLIADGVDYSLSRGVRNNQLSHARKFTFFAGFCLPAFRASALSRILQSGRFHLPAASGYEFE